MATITQASGSTAITTAGFMTENNANLVNLNNDKIETSYIDTDTTLAANSDVKIASQKAVKAYVDSGGNPNASTTAKGVVEEATAAEVAAGTAAGSTGARLFVNPSTLPIASLLASDYSDGSVTVSVNGSLSRDMYYDVLTINTGVILNPAGYRIFARSVVTVGSGAISASGGVGGSPVASRTGGAAGTSNVAGTLPKGIAGKAGADGAGSGGSPGTAGENSTYNINSAAGAGGGSAGAGSVGIGGVGGVGGTNTSTINPPRNIISAFYLFDFTSATAVARYNVTSGSGSGAGGGFGNGSLGGGGGGGSGGSGGIVFIAAETITNAGSISANGGNGGNGSNAFATNDAGGGGGGGGNGGAVILIYSTLINTGTITASAGAKGVKGTSNGTAGASADGVAGTAGVVIKITK